ncbi:hypothetical protein [Shewanella maritima]|uniref:hypothetical protein n=1 Tax=Shewanella maritima TaxID=2520507 RepID=UPI003735F5AF
MLVKPLQFSQGIVNFSKKPWFHLFEIVSRAVLGILFLLLAHSTPYPVLFKVIGAVLCFVSIFLIIIGATRHKQFALLTAQIGHRFRLLSFLAIGCGLSIVYLSAISYING